MGIRLRFLSAYTPRSILRRELRRVNGGTIGALESLILNECPGSHYEVASHGGRDLERIRDEMADIHEQMVSHLVNCLGKERAIELGREHLYYVGLSLGQDARRRLGVGDSLNDALRAARVLYRVLGIKFRFNREGDGGTLLVNRCALSRRYSSITCLVLSAADEGVLRGLNPRLNMRFEETITSGKEMCRAKIIIEAHR